MNKIPDLISYARAYEIALEAAQEQFSEYQTLGTETLLASTNLETEACWVFFKNAKLEIPQNTPFTDCAFLVTKAGKLSLITDFMPQIEQMKDYVNAISLYHLGNLEASKVALREFNHRYGRKKFII